MTNVSNAYMFNFLKNAPNLGKVPEISNLGNVLGQLDLHFVFKNDSDQRRVAPILHENEVECVFGHVAQIHERVGHTRAFIAGGHKQNMAEEYSKQTAPRFPVVEMVNAFVAFLFAASAPVAIVLGAGARGGLSEADLASWIFAAFAINGALSIGMSIAFRQPLAFFWTIPGTVLVGAALQSVSFAEVIGAYLLTALLLLVLGLTGWVKAVMKRLLIPSCVQ